MWDLIVSVPDHCLSFYFSWCFIYMHLISISCVAVLVIESIFHVVCSHCFTILNKIF